MLRYLCSFVLTDLGSFEIEIFLFALATRWFLAPADRKRTEYAFLASVATLIGVLLSLRFTALASVLRPEKYDLFVYAWDNKVLPVPPAFVIGAYAHTHLWFHILLFIAYTSLGSIMLLTALAYIYGQRMAEVRRMILVFILNPVVAVFVYLLFPVAGPNYAFKGTFPMEVPHLVTPCLLKIDAAPNGIPSVHMSSALLAMWFLRRWWWGRIVGGLFVILTTLATLGLGEHYILDLVCAVPYTALLIWSTEAATSQSSFWIQPSEVK